MDRPVHDDRVMSVLTVSVECRTDAQVAAWGLFQRDLDRLRSRYFVNAGLRAQIEVDGDPGVFRALNFPGLSGD